MTVTKVKEAEPIQIKEVEAETHSEATQKVEHAEKESGQIEHANTLYAEPVFHIGNFPVTNALFTSWIAVGVLVIIALFLRLGLKHIPSKLQHLFEIILEGALDLCDQVTGDRKLTMKVFPITISLFFFILVNNWLGILPITAFGIVEHGEFAPFIRSGTADINTTLALGLIAVVGSNFFGILSLGLWKSFNKFINLKAILGMFKKVKHDPTILVVAPVQFFVGLIEIVGEIAKVASLSFRLFGNVFAGEILLVSMSALIAYVVPLPFLFLEVLVGFIQALIFSMLTLVYFTIASHDHGEEHESHEHAEQHA